MTFSSICFFLKWEISAFMMLYTVANMDNGTCSGAPFNTVHRRFVIFLNGVLPTISFAQNVYPMKCCLVPI